MIESTNSGEGSVTPVERGIEETQVSLSRLQLSEEVRTKIMCVSDTHDGRLELPIEGVDVLVVSGDILGDPKDNAGQQFMRAIQAFKTVDAKLKIVIAGNHDEPLDVGTDPKGYQRTEASKYAALFKNNGIHYLEEGRHEFVLSNGARLKVYASPFTPKRKGSRQAFTYPRSQGHCL